MQRKRTSKAAWIEAALAVLRSEGIQGVRVERLARDLGIAKSGFYWHFKERDDLLQQLLEYWEHEFTEVVSENLELRRLGPRERLTRVAELVLEHDLSGFDLSFRAWAAHDRLVARRVNRVIGKRFDYIREAFAELGFEGQDLDMRTRLFVCYSSAERATYPGVSKKALRELVPLRMALLTGSDRQHEGER